MVPGTGETRRQGRAVPRSTPKAMWAETPKHSAVGEKTLNGHESLRPQVLLFWDQCKPANKVQTDTPGTGVLSSDSHSATHSKDDEQQQSTEQLAAHDDTSTEESSPANTPKASPETQATDTTGASSPEPASDSKQDVDLAAADIPTLQNMEKTSL